jgi:hypothetical protein
MISENLVDNPGEYRTNNIPDTAPKWFEIPREMGELVRLVNSRIYLRSIPVEQSAFTGYRFSQIHAFENHNEQVARNSHGIKHLVFHNPVLGVNSCKVSSLTGGSNYVGSCDAGSGQNADFTYTFRVLKH